MHSDLLPFGRPKDVVARGGGGGGGGGERAAVEMVVLE